MNNALTLPEGRKSGPKASPEVEYSAAAMGTNYIFRPA
jgi:hypothetical protein